MRIVCIANRNSLKLHMDASEEFPLTKNDKLKEYHFEWFQIEIAAQQDTLCSNNHRFLYHFGYCGTQRWGSLFQASPDTSNSSVSSWVTFNLNRHAMWCRSKWGGLKLYCGNNLYLDDDFRCPLHLMIAARSKLLDMLKLGDILMEIVLDQVFLQGKSECSRELIHRISLEYITSPNPED